MTLEKFKSLVDGGEKATVDFKISCNAFNKAARDRDKAKSELVKDICAMANNGAVASYLIISKDSIVYHASGRWGLEHGLIFFVAGSTGALSKAYDLKVGIEELWSGFGLIESRRLGGRRIPGDTWCREHYDWPATFRTLSIPVITLPKIDNTQRLRDLISRSLEGIQGDEILFRYIDTARRQLNQKIQLSLRRSLNPKADPEFNRGAITQFKRHLHAIGRIASDHSRHAKKSSQKIITKGPSLPK